MTIEDSKAHLAWLKQTAQDKQDLARVVGYEDCLREWIAYEQVKRERIPDHSEQPLNMVERVARAIDRAAWDEDFEEQTEKDKDFVREVAKVAIAAMGSQQVQLGSELNLSEELSEADLVAWFEASNFLLNDEAERAARDLKKIAYIRRKP